MDSMLLLRLLGFALIGVGFFFLSRKPPQKILELDGRDILAIPISEIDDFLQINRHNYITMATYAERMAKEPNAKEIQQTLTTYQIDYPDHIVVLRRLVH